MFRKQITIWCVFWLIAVIPVLIGAQTVAPTSVPGNDSVGVIINSVPSGADIYLNNTSLDVVTPYELRAEAGEFLIEVILEGYEPLAKRFEVAAGRSATTEFRLMPFPPNPVSADDLGLVRLPKRALLNMKIADRVENQWTGLAETFAIVPFGQGILARAVLPEEQASSANAMIIVGAGLTASAYLLGKIIGKRKRKQIQAANEQIPAENETIRLNNIEVDETVRAANSAAIIAWQEQNADNGVVIITIN